ncbi:MAG: helix-turn-helix transcriptional regulator [bacterium]
MKRNPKTIKLYSFDDVFRKSSKKAAFRRGYNEEAVRLSIAKQIAALRGSQRLTQKAVAEKAGMPQSVIARIESGETGITVDTLGRIAEAFGKKVQLV